MLISRFRQLDLNFMIDLSIFRWFFDVKMFLLDFSNSFPQKEDCKTLEFVKTWEFFYLNKMFLHVCDHLE